MIKIETGKKPPEKVETRGKGNRKYPFPDLKKGQSFLVDYGDDARKTKDNLMSRRSHQPDKKKFDIQDCPKEGGYRVHKVA